MEKDIESGRWVKRSTEDVAPASYWLSGREVEDLLDERSTEAVV